MNIFFNCQHCGKHLEVDQSGAGMEVPCPVCGKSILIPSNSPSTSIKSPTPTVTQPPVSQAGNVNQEGKIGLKWHYTTDGRRFGPVPESEIPILIKAGEITDESQVWSADLPEWQSILNSKFVDLLRDPNAPPPLTGVAVNNKVVWVLAFAPLITKVLPFSLITAWLSVFGSLFETLICIALNVILCSWDEKKLKAAGHNTSKLGSTWLVPVYLFKRAKMLKQNYACFIVWCALCGATIFFPNLV